MAGIATLNTKHDREHANEMRKRDRKIKLLSVNMHIALLALVTTVVLVIIGGLVILIFKPPRIPIIYQEIDVIRPLTLEQIFLQTFPANLFNVFSQSGNYLLPITILAMLLGLTIKSESKTLQRVPQLLTEISVIFTKLLYIFLEFLGIGIIILSINVILQLRSITDLRIFYQLITLIFITTVAIIFIVYPALAVLFRCKTNPYILLKNLLSPLIVAAVSGDSYFTAPLLLQLFHQRISRNKAVPYNITLVGVLLCRAGSAFVTSIVFFVVLRSYSAIEITLIRALWVMLTIILISPIASTAPRLGIVHMFVIITGLYGNGIENDFLIIIPILPILIIIATVIDTLTVGFVGYLIADKLGLIDAESGSVNRSWNVTKKIIS